MHPAAEPPPLPKPYPGFWHAAGLFLIYVIGTAIVVVPFAVADAIAKTTFVKSPWLLGVASLAGSLLAVQVARKHLALGWREIAGPFRIPAEVMPSMAATIVGQLIVTMMVLFWLLRLFPGLMPKETYGLDRTLLGAAFALMIAAPLGEELLFRGVFLRGFVPRYGLAKGIALGAAMFAAAHMSPGKLFGTFLLGAIFGWWYSKLGSIWPGVIGHALNNGAPVLAAAFAGKNGMKESKLPAFSWAEPVFLVIGVALMLQGILTMRRYFDSLRNESDTIGV
jgi:membrane protease YdiL (CAAX protease family)